MADISGSHPSVDHAMRYAHHGRGKGVVPAPAPLTEEHGMGGYGPVKDGQKGHPGTD